jgi:serine/threonine protein kinase
MTLQVNSLLHQRYRIQEVIAQGGMGAIYRALDESLGVEVALKENLYTAEEATRQFRSEATILAGLRHPNLPRVTDHFVIPDQGQYLVMDFIDGDDLRDRMRANGALPETDAIRIGMSICDALSYLHSRSPAIVHRDIKPGNIKLTPAGQIVLVDFGLAKIASARESTQTGAQALTPGFAPPEQYGQGTDHRSDLYSLGATLYAALTQAVPEDGLSRLTENTHLTPLRQHAPAISPYLADVIEKAMAVSPAERFQSAAEMKIALQNVNQAIQPQTRNAKEVRRSEAATAARYPVSLPEQPNAPHAAPAVPQNRKKFPLVPVLLAAGLVLALGIITLVLVLNWSNDNSRHVAAQPATLPAIAATNMLELPAPTLAAQEVSQVETPLPAISLLPTGTLAPTLAATPLGGGKGQIAFASTRSGQPQIWLMDSDGGNLLQITNMSDGACQPAWSPDGSRLVFTSPCRKRSLDALAGSALFLINADGSGLTPLSFVPGGDFEPDWSPDGRQIAFTSLRDGIPHIYLYDLETNQAVNLSARTSNDRRPAWSPDGSLIAFETTRLGALQIWLMDPVMPEKPREFTLLNNSIGSMAAWSPDGSFITFTQGSGLPWPAFKKFTSIDTPASQHQETRITDLLPAWHTSYSPDGHWLIFEHYDANDPDRNLDIYRAMTNGSDLQRLTDDPGDDFDPAWRPLP